MYGFKATIKPVQKIGGNIEKPKTVVDSDYSLLENKPSINGVTVEGNKSFEDYGLLFDNKSLVKENGILKVADGSHGHTVGNIEGLQETLDEAADHAANENNPHKVTKSQLGLGNVENKSSAAIRGELTSENVTEALGYVPPSESAVQTFLGTKADKTALQAAEKALADHKADAGNPHKVTKSQVGLGNVENKSSAAIRGELTSENVTEALGYVPPSESAVQTALGTKADKTALQAAEKALADHKADAGNPHKVTKSQLGLGNVENKSSATIRGELTKDNVTAALGYTPPTTNTTYAVATTSANGLMSSSDKIKLNGIAAGAQVNTITGVKGNSESSYRTGNVNISAANIGLSNVENKSSATIRGELTKANVVSALGYTPASESGAVETVSNVVRRQLRPSDLFRIF